MDQRGQGALGKMKILFSGYHNPHFVNSMVYREKAVGYLGHELVPFDDRGFLLPGRIRGLFPVAQQWDLRRLNSGLLRLAESTKPDICLIVGGQRVLPKTVAAIKGQGIRIALWTTDVPIDFKNILEAASFYDHLFCAGTEAADIFKAKGLKAVSWVPFACDPHFHQPVALSDGDKKRYGRDAIFIGSYYPNRAKLLEAVADKNLGVWGPYWQKLPGHFALKAKATDIKMNYDQWVKIFSAAKINIVIHYQDAHVPCHQASPKLFEAMACGCFVLTDRQKDAQALFKDKEHVVFFDDAQDLREKIQYYLNHDEERHRIADHGRREVLAAHTYEHRIKHMLDMMRNV